MQLLFSVVFVYLLIGRTVWDGDNLPARYLPLSILREFDFDLDEFMFLYDTGMSHALREINGHIVSTYPPWGAILALPIYLLPILGGISPQSPFLSDLERLTGALITALSVIVLFSVLKRVTTERIAWCIALVYAFGTSSFSTSSQAQFQHGSSQLFLSLAIYCLVRGADEARFSAYAGFPLASAILCRPLNVLIALPLWGYILHKRRDQLPGFLLASGPPLLLFMAYNAVYFGSPFTIGFASTVFRPSSLWTSSGLFSVPLLEGLNGILASPSRGLLIYSPILIFAFMGMVMVWVQPRDVLFKYLSLTPLPIIFITAKWVMWWGGWSYGPRLLADITPILCLYLSQPFEWAKRKSALKYVLVALSALSIGMHTMGAWADGSWNSVPAHIDRQPERLWMWVESPPVYYAKQALTRGKQAFLELKRIVLAMPTSRNAPQQLSAAYRLIGLLPGTELYPGEPLNLRVRARNETKAVWLAHVRDGRGKVQLGWRWFKEGHDIPSTEGRVRLTHNIFPSQAYEFAATLAAPEDPGEYTLAIDLVSGHATWFTAQGVDPLKVSIRVHNPPSVDFENWLTQKGHKTLDTPLSLALATDRFRYQPGDVLKMIMDLVNSGAARVVDIYLALVWPNKMLYSWEENGISPLTDDWSPQRKGLELSKGMRILNHQLLQLKLDGMPDGIYTWHVVLMEPETMNILAMAKAIFILER